MVGVVGASSSMTPAQLAMLSARILYHSYATSCSSHENHLLNWIRGCPMGRGSWALMWWTTGIGMSANGRSSMTYVLTDWLPSLKGRLISKVGFSVSTMAGVSAALVIMNLSLKLIHMALRYTTFIGTPAAQHSAKWPVWFWLNSNVKVKDILEPKRPSFIPELMILPTDTYCPTETSRRGKASGNEYQTVRHKWFHYKERGGCTFIAPCIIYAHLNAFLDPNNTNGSSSYTVTTESHVENYSGCNSAYKILNMAKMVLQIISIGMIGVLGLAKQATLTGVQRSIVFSMVILCFIASKWVSHFVYKTFCFYDYDHLLK
ncbi:LOW QUALITY PROTEIN: hypothetical protein Cgig2_015805 [Carnegiea gigantea]|uniref:Uncharacterized protein n=1 Tax=Carnegiea gigantea TaxID=171969 RepID=A0A9Q1QIR1_9CARY|nr:LOW QUALITY PROTEIN: hypothetical protein Cgig2_015805 [Carnegiea gigantea]